MSFSPLINLLIILVCGSAVWYSGTQLALFSDWIGDRYKISRAFVGALFLAFATSLPELATTVTASWLGNAPLAINNLLGGINLQTVVIAIADLCIVSGALTYFSPKPSLLVGGLFVILQLAIVTIAASTGELFTFWGVGFWPVLLFAVYLLMLHFIINHENDPKWKPVIEQKKLKMKFETPSKKDFSSFKLISFFLFNALVVLVAGSAISYFANTLAYQWNWSGGWMGATLVALTTSLPEVSTTLGAVRQKAYVLAIANIFGSNALTISLLLPADIFYRKGAIIDVTDPSNIFLGGVGTIITGLYLWGILDRENRTLLRMGVDSLIVLLVYSFSLYLLWQFA